MAIYRRYHLALEQSAALAARLGDDRQDRPTSAMSTPFEEVRDFFYARHNYIAELDEAAERTGAGTGRTIQQVAASLAERLKSHHGIDVRVGETSDASADLQRNFDAGDKTLRLSARLQPGQQAFQIGTQLVGAAVAENYWRNAFFQMLQDKNWPGFIEQFWVYAVIAVFHICGAVYQRYLSQWLTIRWRGWMTSYYLDRWLEGAVHYRAMMSSNAVDNPDQRITAPHWTLQKSS
ncbi:hypothetical protein [Rhodopseudomonas palustris]|uniref:ABC transmembrane type-1 domain-containing protein n=1 Tax=Rhodopseudomonas palustris (strain ATCC BAA-98 / CGA009) TaxID=258594 RepID=A0AAE9Y0A6_RHOPA|nr:hypothetical protein [Rhodopseudomonas palustris]WAB80046.1 hypothetical protein OR798_12365 [Rhodopseudomonas palustris]WCL92552.1 hypothetical protein TX73_012360 [Rhodopseudomonas palustris CGA009]WND53936.1 hypothetical protein L1A21_12320 [Rhodopseudomonas palustris]